MPEPIEYRVGLADRLAHLYRVEARFPAAAGEVELRLPVWTPGSYLVREFERHIQDLACADAAGAPLAARKIDKATWRVSVPAATTLVVRYRVYAHDLTVRTSHLDATHAYWNGACLFLYVEALRDRAIRVTIEDLPEGWRASTALEIDAADPGSLTANNYDTLVDSPVEIGPHEPIATTVAGRPCSFVLYGRPAAGPRDFATFTRDITAIAEGHAALFGGVPYDRYTFLLHLVPGAHGGLEHKSSTTVLATPFAFSSETKYQDLLELASHEYFHLWNVKRIHPEVLGPFDYTREAYTRSLWVVEGWTSYYDRLGVRRAGLLSADRYLEKLGDELTRLAATPGRRHASLEAASFDAWIKYYRPDENSVNSTVSYYLKGSIAALLLDLEIRRRTSGKKTLDDAMRLLWQRYGREGRGYPDTAVNPLVEEAAGVPLDDFFARAVRGTDELELDAPLASVGLRAKVTAQLDDDDRPNAWLGATLAQEGDRLRVTEALEGSPAQAGALNPGDQIVALDGYRVDKDALADRLGARRPGDSARLTLFRRDELLDLTIRLGSTADDAAPRTIEIAPAEDPPAEAREAYRAWLGEEWKKEE